MGETRARRDHRGRRRRLQGGGLQLRFGRRRVALPQRRTGPALRLLARIPRAAGRPGLSRRGLRPARLRRFRQARGCVALDHHPLRRGGRGGAHGARARQGPHAGPVVGRLADHRVRRHLPREPGHRHPLQHLWRHAAPDKRARPPPRRARPRDRGHDAAPRSGRDARSSRIRGGDHPARPPPRLPAPGLAGAADALAGGLEPRHLRRHAGAPTNSYIPAT